MSAPLHIPPEQRYAAADAKYASTLSTLSEKQKMLAGLPYDPSDADLRKAIYRVRKLFRTFNSSEGRDEQDGNPAMTTERRQLFAQILGVQEEQMASNVYVEPPFWCDYGTNIKLQGNFYCNFNTTILDCAEVIIGDGVLFGPNGGNVTIMAGVTIGRGCTIGAGSTVTKSIPDWSIALGSPAKVLRTLSEQERGDVNQKANWGWAEKAAASAGDDAAKKEKEI
ncbi:trimeric LpxA-like protein [Ceraceosorus guamensis]|uniref:Trimeric LpxA-like protein n=1 Tax=Ceraceosorus guamensis TaxID=1522189 RepID=A0A316VS04_9BASI|nr:trimeric LpxA-like protein [Ceraceosorus guamensis]PWN40140.1 trimeric LpxA-like protein [Ceraceosorus guamensis]